ncbi:MAG TPA: bile acid:sodium symporter family protein [Candidatus Corynebacterium avicola]|uniref:Bile acid:sodium symporter family protein n=1 Tax=Candidatus Corynebacterium avicola TaxID=2838527 RepID=A0A9D1RM70_9CORY|nr:bile acid:sodium symporter family protein [Candidatus Corynebacterium avicola]
MQDGIGAQLLPLGLAVIMVGIGLTLTPTQFRRSVNSTATVTWGLIGQVVVVPLIALALAFILNLSPVLAVGLMLLAAAPGGVTTNLFAHLAKGNVPLSIVLTVITSILMMATLPLWVWVTVRLFEDVTGDVGAVTVPPGEAIGLVVGVVGVPVIIGMMIRAKSERIAAKLEKIIAIVGVVVLVGVFAFLAIDLGDELGPLLREVGLAVIIFNALVMVAGWAIGAILKRPVEDKVTLAVEFGLRNSTMSMVIALSVIGSTEIAAPAMLFSVTMYIFGVGLLVWRRTASKKQTSDAPTAAAEGAGVTVPQV